MSPYQALVAERFQPTRFGESIIKRAESKAETARQSKAAKKRPTEK